MSWQQRSGQIFFSVRRLKISKAAFENQCHKEDIIFLKKKIVDFIVKNCDIELKFGTVVDDGKLYRYSLPTCVPGFYMV